MKHLILEMHFKYIGIYLTVRTLKLNSFKSELFIYIVQLFLLFKHLPVGIHCFIKHPVLRQNGIFKMLISAADI